MAKGLSRAKSDEAKLPLKAIDLRSRFAKAFPMLSLSTDLCQLPYLASQSEVHINGIPAATAASASSLRLTFGHASRSPTIKAEEPLVLNCKI
ncbi:hypothetical protein, partial [Moorena sp. SIO3I6]|uniref:hypothetical protein n=1 Tax=Moorena sp. SIO3I6 TaxID=2607831 RepID=UPI0025F2AB5B